MAKKKAAKAAKKTPKPAEPKYALRCKHCRACQVLDEVAPSFGDGELTARQWNTVLLQNPCEQWDDEVLRKFFRAVLRSAYDVRPSKKCLQEFAAKHSLEDMLVESAPDDQTMEPRPDAS